SVSPSLSAVFDNELVRSANSKAYVPSNANVRSLGAIEIITGNLEFYVNDYDPSKKKLRAQWSEGGVIYDLAITSAAEIQRWHDSGIDGLRAFWEQKDIIHVRVGLSRPFPQRPDGCYAQINGLL